jgi:hypothetical protein
MNNNDLTKPDLIKKDYYNTSKNSTHGNKREKNIINYFYNQDENVWEIKTDYQIRITGNVFFEVEQILYGKETWIKSGLSLNNKTNLWHIGIPITDDKDMKNGKIQNPIILNKKTIINIIKKHIDNEEYVVGRQYYGMPYFVEEGHKPYYSYTKDIKVFNSLHQTRYSRGILIPLLNLINPFYLENNAPKLMWQPDSYEYET